MESQDRYKEDLDNIEEGEDSLSLLHLQRRPSRSRKWLELSVLLLLGLSIGLNVLTHVAGNRDLDEICSIYTSQTGG